MVIAGILECHRRLKANGVDFALRKPVSYFVPERLMSLLHVKDARHGAPANGPTRAVAHPLSSAPHYVTAPWPQLAYPPDRSAVRPGRRRVFRRYHPPVFPPARPQVTGR